VASSVNFDARKDRIVDLGVDVPLRVLKNRISLSTRQPSMMQTLAVTPKGSSKKNLLTEQNPYHNNGRFTQNSRNKFINPSANGLYSGPS
jgi:hypothetical protein